jgi:hypothetical protein
MLSSKMVEKFHIVPPISTKFSMMLEELAAEILDTSKLKDLWNKNRINVSTAPRKVMCSLL